MTSQDFNDFFGGIESIITSISIAVVGIWTYRKFVLQQERYPNLVFVASVNFIGEHKNEWLVELVADVENKGKAQHKMKNFNFDLNAIFEENDLIESEKWGKQINFPNLLIKGSFLPDDVDFFFVDPGTTARYSFISKVPKEASFVILHSYFNYSDKRNYRHSAEFTAKVPPNKP
jgi:hypothetical protein